MDGLFTQDATSQTAQPRRWLCGVVALWLSLAALTARSEEHFDGFEDDQTSWKIRVAEGELAPPDQRRLTNSKAA